MEKQEIEKIYNELGENKIDELYYYSVLLTSGFNKDNAYKLIGTLKDLWLEDENDYSISKISDMLYDVYDDIEDKIDDMSDRELLEIIYNGYYDDEDDYDDEII